MKRSMKKQLQGLYQAPEPQQKAVFLEKLNYPKATLWEFMGTQAGYIHKYVWILSAALVCGAVMAGGHMKGGGELFTVLWYVSSVMPVLALLLTLETFRSEQYGMDELEQTTKHNLPEVLLMRMGIVGAADFLLIAATIPVIVRYDGLGVFRAAVYLLVPYLLTCLLSLIIQRQKRGRENVWYSILASVIVCAVNIFSKAMDGILYEEKWFIFWVLALLLTGAAVAVQVRIIRKNREEYGWNLYLTE